MVMTLQGFQKKSIMQVLSCSYKINIMVRLTAVGKSSCFDITFDFVKMYCSSTFYHLH